MAFSKKHKFSTKEIRLSEFAKALSHPARIAIVKMLAERNTCVCGEIVEDLPLAQSTISQHLKALKDAGIIKGEIEGPTTCYCLNGDVLKGLSDQFSEFMKSTSKKCC